jgi:hypothetical protein
MRVKEPICESHISVYSMDPETQVNEWQDLKNYKHIVVGFSKGGSYLDRMARQYRLKTQTFYGATNYTPGTAEACIQKNRFIFRVLRCH